MASVSRREPLPLEDVTEVASAPRALDFDPFAVRIGETADRSGDLLVEGRPTAMGVELVVRPIEGSPALLAFVRPGVEVRLVFARERRFGAFVEDHALFRAR